MYSIADPVISWPRGATGGCRDPTEFVHERRAVVQRAGQRAARVHAEQEYSE
jgi:hypothetical protein